MLFRSFQFLKDIAPEELRNYTISYDFNIINAKTSKRSLINHKITPLRLTENGKVWLALCVASISSSNESGNIIMTKNKASVFWAYNQKSSKWDKTARPELKDVEIEVLKLSAMGYTMVEIADEVNRSFDTVKVYRKNILEKLGVQNIVEAINLALTYKIL